MTITNFSEAKQYLRRFYNQNGPYKLETMREFMAFLDNPQDKVRVIHVAGTSGKTSTAYYIAGLLQAAGYRTGLTTSPHVDEINERVQIDLMPLPEKLFCEQLNVFSVLVEDSGLQLSYFEAMVAFAYWYFAKVKVDYAVIEVGLGGRIDGTNVVTRQDKISVITNIGFDHTKILGNTLPEIAAEKAGIILHGNDVFTHAQAPEIVDVFKRVCQQRQASLHIVEEYRDADLEALPLFQQHNMGLAVAVAQEALARQNRNLEPRYIHQAVGTYVPARMERITYGGRQLILDGAHNGQKLQTLLESVSEKYPRQAIAAVVAFVTGDEQRMHEGLAQIMRFASHIIVTEFSVEQDVPKQSVPAQQIMSWCQEKGYDSIEIAVQPKDALAKLLARPEPVLLVTGSFYLLNHIRPLTMKA